MQEGIILIGSDISRFSRGTDHWALRLATGIATWRSGVEISPWQNEHRRNNRQNVMLEVPAVLVAEPASRGNAA